VSELWPDLSEEEQVRQREYLERRCQGGILLIRRLGRMYAAALNSRASPLRYPLLEQRRQLLFWRKQSGLLYDGPAYADIKFALSDPDMRFAETSRCYAAQDAAGIAYCDAIIE